jgi:hypothetical protein
MNNNPNLNIKGYNQLPLMDQIIGQIMKGGVDLSITERLPQKAVDSIIELSLRKNGIDTEYQFGIFENGEVVFSNVTDVGNLINSKYVMDVFPASEVITMLIRGDGNCAKVQWELFGVSMPGWVLFVFIVLAGIGLFQLLRKH